MPTQSLQVPTVSAHVSDWGGRLAIAFQAHRTGLTASAARIVGPAHAADVVQDVFIRVWSNPNAFDATRGTLTTYLYLVTRGISIDRVRSCASQRARDIRDASRNPAVADEPVSDIVADEQRKDVRRAVSKLTEREREVVLAAYFGGLTYRQIALRLGLPEGTVKSRIRVALVRMRVELNRAELVAA